MKKFSIIIAIFLQVAPLLANATSAVDIDTREIVSIGGRRYYFSELMMTAPEAMTVCQELGMTLAGLETVEEFNAVTDYMRAQGKDQFYFTSGTRIYDTWTWSCSGMPAAYLKWDVAEPTISDLNRQVLICLVNGFMNDCWPYGNLKFICEDQMPSCP